MPLQPFRHPGQVDPQNQGIGLVRNIQNANFNQKRNALLDLKTDEFKSPGATAARAAAQNTAVDEAELKSIIAGFTAAYPMLASGDVEGTLNSLRARRQTLIESGRKTQHTDEMISGLEDGLAETDPAIRQQKIAEATEIMGQFVGAEQGGDFTLAAGAQRRNAAGQLIAENPKEPTQPEKVRIALEAGLEPGTQKYSDFLLGKSEGTGDVRDRKISDAIRLNPGLSEQRATKIVDGQATFELNEKTGRMLYTDLVTGEVEEVAINNDNTETPAPQPGQTLRDLAGVATGPVSGLTAKGAAALSFFNVNPDERSTGAQQTFRTHTQSLIRALAINPRFPVAEMNRIKEEISIQPGIFQGRGTLVKKIDSLDESLRLRLSQAERDFNDPNLDVATRQAQGANASALRNFLTILGGNPQEGDALADEIAQLEEELGL